MAGLLVALALSAISLARNPGGAGSTAGREDAKVEQFTADVLGWTGGRYLVGAIGLVVLGIGAAFAWKGLSGDFAKQVENRRVGPFSWNLIRKLGVVGWVGRGAMMGLIGWFVLRAAIEFDAEHQAMTADALHRPVAAQRVAEARQHALAEFGGARHQAVALHGIDHRQRGCRDQES